MIRALLGGLTALALLAAAPAFAQVTTPRADDRVVGQATAPVTLTAYVSTTCGHCARWHALEWPLIEEKWVRTGKVKVVFRDFLTGPRDASLKGATLARCAAPERFDTTMGALMSGQPALEEGDGAERWLQRGIWASGLTDAQAQGCLADPANTAATEARDAAAYAAGVQRTPSFFINGRPTEAWTAPEFDTALAAASGAR